MMHTYVVPIKSLLFPIFLTIPVQATNPHQGIRFALHIAQREKHIAAPVADEHAMAMQIWREETAKHAPKMGNLNGNDVPFYRLRPRKYEPVARETVENFWG